MAIMVKLFGALRKFGDSVTIDLDNGRELTIPEIRNLLEGSIETSEREVLRSLLEVSAFADERSILANDARIRTNTTVFLLPPVCGG